MTKKTLRNRPPRRKHAAAQKQRSKPKTATNESVQPTAAPPVEAPKPEITAFASGEVNQGAPLMTLVAAMFSAPNMPAKFADPSAEFMANMLHSLADEAELSGAANNGLDLSEVQDRAMYRLDQRARISVEIARRLQTGKVAP